MIKALFNTCSVSSKILLKCRLVLYIVASYIKKITTCSYPVFQPLFFYQKQFYFIYYLKLIQSAIRLRTIFKQIASSHKTPLLLAVYT